MLAEIPPFVNWARRRNPAAHTWRDYRCDLEQFAAAVGEKPLAVVGFQDVDRFVTAQVERGLKPCHHQPAAGGGRLPLPLPCRRAAGLVCPVIPHRHLLRAAQRLPRAVAGGRPGRFFAVIENAVTEPSSCSCCAAACASPRSPTCGCATSTCATPRPACWCAARTARSAPSTSPTRLPTALRRYLAERPTAPSAAVFLNYRARRWPPSASRSGWRSTAPPPACSSPPTSCATTSPATSWPSMCRSPPSRSCSAIPG